MAKVLNAGTQFCKRPYLEVVHRLTQNRYAARSTQTFNTDPFYIQRLKPRDHDRLLSRGFN